MGVTQSPHIVFNINHVVFWKEKKERSQARICGQNNIKNTVSDFSGCPGVKNPLANAGDP